MPTARDPGAMLANAAVLLVVAVVLLVAAARLALRVAPGPGRTPAALGMLALVLGTGGYLLNLVARWAVVLSGATGLQAAVEDTAWQAHAYLPGLDAAPTFVGLLLVLLDLLQLVYVVLTYLGIAALAVALGRAGALSPSGARRIHVAGVVLAALVLAGAVLAPLLPATAGSVAAWAGFVLTIPFMSTLLPFAMGLGLLRQRSRALVPVRHHRKRPSVGSEQDREQRSEPTGEHGDGCGVAAEYLVRSVRDASATPLCSPRSAGPPRPSRPPPGPGNNPGATPGAGKAAGRRGDRLLVRVRPAGPVPVRERLWV